jgi:hypothetical protein
MSSAPAWVLPCDRRDFGMKGDDRSQLPDWRALVVTYTDPEYVATKLVKQGQAILAAPFATLAEWIASTWQVAVLNVIYDRPAVLARRPRLQVIVENCTDLEQCFEGLNFDPAKQQAIAARFGELVNLDAGRKYSIDGLLVVFSAFAPLARQEADSRVTEGQVEALQARIGNRALWQIARCFGRVDFLFFTDEEARAHTEAGFLHTYADLYFDLLRPHDEFGYLSRSRFAVRFDSKENFEKTYDGNWFYYFK